eukprot:SAG31_NODE_6647_length_1939_cov_14.997826_2_plen_244_part_00
MHAILICVILRAVHGPSRTLIVLASRLSMCYHVQAPTAHVWSKSLICSGLSSACSLCNNAGNSSGIEEGLIVLIDRTPSQHMPESELEASAEPQKEPEASAQPQSEREASAEPQTSEPEASAEEPESDLEASAEPQISEPEASAEEPESEPNKASAESSWSIVAEWLAIMITITAIVYGMWLLLGPVTEFTAWSRGFTGTATLFGDTRHHLRSLCACTTSEYAFPSCRFDFEATVAVPGWQSM